jgi:hypothetical protein
MLPAFVCYQLGERDTGYDRLGLASRLWRAMALGVLRQAGRYLERASAFLLIGAGGCLVVY